MPGIRLPHPHTPAVVALLVCSAALALGAADAGARPVDPPGLYAQTHHAVVAAPADRRNPDARGAAIAAATPTPASPSRSGSVVVAHKHANTLPIVLAAAALIIALASAFMVLRMNRVRRRAVSVAH